MTLSDLWYPDTESEFIDAMFEANERTWAQIRERDIQLDNDLYEHSAE